MRSEDEHLRSGFRRGAGMHQPSCSHLTFFDSNTSMHLFSFSSNTSTRIRGSSEKNIHIALAENTSGTIQFYESENIGLQLIELKLQLYSSC